MKNERGITLLVLIITVIIMIILIGVGISTGGTSYTEVKLQNFSYELQQIQGRVDAMYEKMQMKKTSDYIYIVFEDQTLGQDITSISTPSKAREALVEAYGTRYDYSNSPSLTDTTLFYNKPGSSIYNSYYRYFRKEDLENILDIKNPGQDVIINFKERQVISVDGITYNDLTYYTLDDMK